ncbi:hypothetical protein [Variovorax sp. LG9.2]|uniref:hypothetical protein n=1 Tax=Variovorax sp. LG9.2 TaxID=3048626 RepID=UPI002B23DBC4|nr:hypothetical protein [Variovorax sp. LG9.2]MEB0056493.1 hypothetical protein [Variovorax sp. LG9.2]
MSPADFAITGKRTPNGIDAAATSIFATCKTWRERKEIVRLCGRFAVAGALLEIVDRMPGAIWLGVVRDLWSTIDGDRRELTRCLREVVEEGHRDLRNLMKSGARRKHALLPQVVVAYRGCCEAINDDGASYSLKKETAARFLGLMRYRIDDETPILLTRQLIPDACFLVDDRGENEIVDLWASADINAAEVEYLSEAVTA